MLKHQLIHPKINEVLGRAGHHSAILIADGNYPASTKKGPNAEVVCLNLSPGCVTVAQVLRALRNAAIEFGDMALHFVGDVPLARQRAGELEHFDVLERFFQDDELVGQIGRAHV